jgi:hypothetical protein
MIKTFAAMCMVVVWVLIQIPYLVLAGGVLVVEKVAEQWVDTDEEGL